MLDCCSTSRPAQPLIRDGRLRSVRRSERKPEGRSSRCSRAGARRALEVEAVLEGVEVLGGGVDDDDDAVVVGAAAAGLDAEAFAPLLAALWPEPPHAASVASAKAATV